MLAGLEEIHHENASTIHGAIHSRTFCGRVFCEKLFIFLCEMKIFIIEFLLPDLFQLELMGQKKICKKESNKIAVDDKKYSKGERDIMGNLLANFGIILGLPR